MRRIALALLLVAAVLAGCVGADDPAGTASSPDAPDEAESPPVVDFSKVHTPDEIAGIVAGYDALEDVDVQRIGTSLQGRPIHLATVGDGPFEVWIVARQHGDEPTGGEAALLTIEALAHPDAAVPDDAPQAVHDLHRHREELLDRLTLHVVPVANPDGAAAYQRGTATGADPNRDHFAFAHPFSRALREAFWERQPDACLDLHNEGLGDTDYDAFGAEGPLMEAETYDLLREDASLAVREVDAAGGNAGSYNENYRAPVADDYPNPTAFHPGTHDVFCTARGAPGWTPEAAIEGGSNGATDPVFAWATGLHQVTVAASALHWAGAYDASEPRVWKAGGPLGPRVHHEVEVEDPGEAVLQVVWRQTTTGGDHNPAPVRLTVTTPDGEVHEGRTPHPEAWTSTVRLPEAGAGTYTLEVDGPPDGVYEARTYVRPDAAGLVDVDRVDDGLQVVADDGAPGPVSVQLTDVADPTPVEAGDLAPPARQVQVLEGPVDTRLVVRWNLTLDPGDARLLEEPDALEAQGPYRWTAEAGDRLDAGVEDAHNPAPD